jgi:polar amino acid transport system substrate-binding protein
MSHARIIRAGRFLFLVLASVLLAVGCGSGSSKSSSGGSGSSGKTPAPLKAGGDMVYCTDVPYPPAEYQQGSDYAGYEVELGRAIAKQLGVKAVFQKTGFDGIIGALQAKKCDAIISSMNVTPEREQQVAFVKYMTIGQAVAVPPKDAGTINSLADLSGKVVAVQVGTTLKALIDKQNKSLDTPIETKLFPDAGAAASALQTGKVDAFFADAPVVADYVNKQPKAFAIGGTQIDELPAGIALRKSDTDLKQAVQKAVDKLYADGTVKEIFTKFHVDSFMLKGN